MPRQLPEGHRIANMLFQTIEEAKAAPVIHAGMTNRQLAQYARRSDKVGQQAGIELYRRKQSKTSSGSHTASKSKSKATKPPQLIAAAALSQLGALLTKPASRSKKAAVVHSIAPELAKAKPKQVLAVVQAAAKEAPAVIAAAEVKKKKREKKKKDVAKATKSELDKVKSGMELAKKQLTLKTMGNQLSPEEIKIHKAASAAGIDPTQALKAHKSAVNKKKQDDLFYHTSDDPIYRRLRDDGHDHDIALARATHTNAQIKRMSAGIADIVDKRNKMQYDKAVAASTNHMGPFGKAIKQLAGKAKLAIFKKMGIKESAQDEDKPIKPVVPGTDPKKTGTKIKLSGASNNNGKKVKSPVNMNPTTTVPKV